MRIKNNFEQEQQPGEPTLLNFKTYYKATVTRQCGIDKQTHRSNGTQYRVQKQSHTDTKKKLFLAKFQNQQRKDTLFNK